MNLSLLRNKELLADIGWKLHSEDFRLIRANFILLRIKLLSIVFAVSSLVWLPFDFFLLDSSLFGQILYLRIGFSMAFAMLFTASFSAVSIWKSLGFIAYMIVMSLLFYVDTQQIVAKEATFGIAAIGYRFMPIIMLSLLAVFPLNLLEGIGFALMVFAGYVIAGMTTGTLMTVSSLGELWLMACIFLVSVFINLTKLHMLLHLYREATIDTLTGLIGRKVLMRILNNEFFKRSNGMVTAPLSIMMIDLDYFKRINDTYGHNTGDQVLKSFARILKRNAAKCIFPGRYGGEEFMVVAPGVDIDTAAKVAEKIRQDCKAEVILSDSKSLITYSASIGVAQAMPDENLLSLIRRVDDGLYEAKNKGRDRVHVLRD